MSKVSAKSTSVKRHAATAPNRKWIHTTPDKGSFTSDEVLDAWQSGVKDGESQAQRVLEKRLSENMVQAFNATKQLIDEFKKRKIIVSAASMKVDGPSKLKVMILVPDTFLRSKGVYDAYKIISSVENSVVTDNYYMDFALLAEGKVDHARLSSEGYVWKFNPNFSSKK